MLKSTYKIPVLPPPVEFETIAILKAVNIANRNLAELKGMAKTIPNQGILIDSLSLQEAKASSEIENIITTQEELFQADLFPEYAKSASAKEVSLYRDAVKFGFSQLQKSDFLITNGMLVDIYRLLKSRSDGFRATLGTALKNEKSNEIVYVPPQSADEIISAMTKLEKFINDDEMSSLDPLIKMAIIHHQFESIHPFSDGNGRIGRILNVLYLTKMDLLDIPILYLSRHIIKTKDEYYRLLQAVRDEGAWQEWVIYMLDAIAKTAKITVQLIEKIRELMAQYKYKMRKELPTLYSQDLLNNLFRHPYTRIEYVQKDVGLKSRQTASKYLEKLTEAGFVEKQLFGRNNYYINIPLVELFLDASS